MPTFEEVAGSLDQIMGVKAVWGRSSEPVSGVVRHPLERLTRALKRSGNRLANLFENRHQMLLETFGALSNAIALALQGLPPEECMALSRE